MANVTYEELRDDLLHEAHRLKAEIVALAIMLEAERQIHRRQTPFTWLSRFKDQLRVQLAHDNYQNTHLEEWVANR